MVMVEEVPLKMIRSNLFTLLIRERLLLKNSDSKEIVNTSPEKFTMPSLLTTRDGRGTKNSRMRMVASHQRNLLNANLKKIVMEIWMIQ